MKDWRVIYFVEKKKKMVEVNSLEAARIMVKQIIAHEHILLEGTPKIKYLGDDLRKASLC